MTDSKQDKSLLRAYEHIKSANSDFQGYVIKSLGTRDGQYNDRLFQLLNDLSSVLFDMAAFVVFEEGKYES